MKQQIVCKVCTFGDLTARLFSPISSIIGHVLQELVHCKLWSFLDTAFRYMGTQLLQCESLYCMCKICQILVLFFIPFNILTFCFIAWYFLLSAINKNTFNELKIKWLLLICSVRLQFDNKTVWHCFVIPEAWWKGRQSSVMSHTLSLWYDKSVIYIYFCCA